MFKFRRFFLVNLITSTRFRIGRSGLKNQGIVRVANIYILFLINSFHDVDNPLSIYIYCTRSNKHHVFLICSYWPLQERGRIEVLDLYSTPTTQEVECANMDKVKVTCNG